MGKLTCQDLMVGDWVNYKSPSSGKLRPIKIVNIYGCEFNCEVENWNIISGKSISDTEPIPLTEEILVKNGFEYAYNEVSEMQNKQLLVANIGGNYIEVRLDKKNVAIWYDYDENESGFYSDVLLELPIAVHQLQHLLHSCGINKEIEL